MVELVKRMIGRKTSVVAVVVGRRTQMQVQKRTICESLQ